MHLQSVELVRFKAFERAQFELAPLTVLIGPNNAGKSSLLQALALARQSVGTNRVVTSGTLVDLGPNASDLVHSLRSPAVEGNSWKSNLCWHDRHTAVDGSKGTDVALDLHIDSGNLSSPASTAFTVTLNAPGLRESALSVLPPEDGQPIVRSEFSVREPSSQAGGNWNVIGHPATRVQGLWNPQIQYDPPIPGGAPEVELFPVAAEYLRATPAALGAISYVGPERVVDRSVYPLGTAASPNPRTAQDVLDTLAYNKALLQAVSGRCADVFGFGIDISLMPERQVALMATSSDGASINAVNVGSGMIQLIWIVLQLELASPLTLPSGIVITPTVGIEEPEIHLHPAKQPDMAKILVDYATRRTQIICTTQSEHLLMAFLQMVLAGRLNREQLAVYYVEKGVAERLEVDEQGRLSQGLRGFFEANERELIQQMELLMRRG